MPTGRRRSPGTAFSNGEGDGTLRLVPATRSDSSSHAPSPSPAFGESISPVAGGASPGVDFATTSAGRNIAALQDREARQRLFRRCDRTNRGSISCQELLDGIAEACPQLNDEDALRRAFVAADMSRNHLVPRREFRLMLEYALFFRDAADALHRIGQLASSSGDRCGFGEFVRCADELLPDNDYDEAQLNLHFQLLDKEKMGYIGFVDVWKWAATEHVATRGGDAGAPGSPRVAYVWDGEPLSVAATANNWREAVRNHWMTAVRLQAPEKLPQALRVGRAQAAAGSESVRSRPTHASTPTDLDNSERGEEDQRPAAVQTLSVSTTEEMNFVDTFEPFEDTFQMPNKERRRETFTRMDRNRNGKLSVGDYSAGLDILWPGLIAEHKPSVQRAFAAVDTRQIGVLGTREFPRLLEYTLYFYRHREGFDAVERDGHGRVNESDFASICEQTGVGLSESEMKREFAALDLHDPVNGHYQTGYIPFEQYCRWAAQHYIRMKRKLTEEERMLERSKQRQDRKASDSRGLNKRQSHSRVPQHHRDGHGNHNRAWERHKGLEGADAFYNLDRNPGQDWTERRHGASLRSTSKRFTSHTSDTPPPGHYHKESDLVPRRRANRNPAPFTGAALRTDVLELAPSSPFRKAAQQRKQVRSSDGSRSSPPMRGESRSPRTRRTWVDDHESKARDIRGTATQHADKTTDLHYRPQSEFDVDELTRRHEKGPFIGRADRWPDSATAHSPGPGQYAAHEAWIDPTGRGPSSAHSFGTPQYRDV